MDLKTIASSIGEGIGYATQKVIQFIANLGVSVSSQIAKVISLIIILGGIYITMKLLEKPIKYLILVLLLIVAGSIGYSIFQ